MGTECKGKSFRFQDLGKRCVVADFEGGEITSNAGALLLREVERRHGVIAALAECFEDHRAAEMVEHPVRDLVAQRVMGLALGYEDLNDHDDLRRDPALAAAVGKEDPLGGGRVRESERGKALAGKSTLNRLELSAAERDGCKKTPVDAGRARDLFVELFVATAGEPEGPLVLDVDTTMDAVHGSQEGRWFNAFYNEHCYLARYVFCGQWLLSAQLRSAKEHAAAGTVEDLERIVPRLRRAWPEVGIVVRADSAFAREEIMAWCETNGVEYVIGMARNTRLEGMILAEMAVAGRRREETGGAAREFADLRYRTNSSWSRERRVVAKAECTPSGDNPRFVVTSLEAAEVGAGELYERVYCGRGDMENRIKEQQMGLFSDRTSTRRMASNQLRLWFASAAYWLLHLLRETGLKGTSLARAQSWTIQLKLLRIGALVRVSVRRVSIRMAGGCPHQDVFARAWERLAAGGA